MNKESNKCIRSLDKVNLETKSPEMVYRITKKPIVVEPVNSSSKIYSSIPVSQPGIFLLGHSYNGCKIKVKVLLGNKNNTVYSSTDKDVSSGNISDLSNRQPKLLSKNSVKTGHVLSIINEYSQPKEMAASVQMIDDTFSFNQEIRDFLSGQNKNYSVVGIIGFQGTGKSTLLSMLAGNDSMDMYRQYIFRPCPKEAVELCRHQTTKVWLYISHETRTIFLDTQAINSASLYEDYLKLRRRQVSPMEAFRLESLQILMLVVNICHTLVLCFDWFIDLNVIRELMKISLINMGNENRTKKTNMLLVHHRARQSDFNPLVVQQRVRVLHGIFENSPFDCFGGINMASFGIGRYSHIKSPINYILLPELKPRMRFDTSYGTANDICGINYTSIMSALRLKLFQLKPYNLLQCATPVTELEWFILANKFWNRIIHVGHSLIEDNFEAQNNLQGISDKE